MSVYLIGVGAALPRRIVTNEEISASLGIAPEWIIANSGIRERRWAAADESTSDLAVAAAVAALEDAGVAASEVDYLIGGTISPDYQVPGIAPLVARRLPNCRRIPALDVRVGCAAALYSLQLAAALIGSRMAKTVVCFGAEIQSKGLQLDRAGAELSMLFGDGAGAVVVADHRHPARPSLLLEDIVISTDGAFAEDLTVRAPGTGNGPHWFDDQQHERGLHYGSMNGRTVILTAVRKLTEAVREMAARHRIEAREIDLVIPHQANLNLLTALGKQLEIAPDRFVVNVDRYGNTGGASVYLALAQAKEEGRWQSGRRVMLLAFGAGFTWGAALGRIG